MMPSAESSAAASDQAPALSKLSLDQRDADGGKNHRGENKSALQRDHAVNRQAFVIEFSQVRLEITISRRAHSGLDHQ